MNILIEGMSRQLGGMEVFMMSIYRRLSKKGYHFDFIAYDDKIVFEEELVKNGSNVFHVTPRSKSLIKLKKELNQVFKEHDYQVFWTNKTSVSNIEAVKAAKKNRVPLRIVYSHLSENRGTKFTWMMHVKNRKSLKKYANQFMACSEGAAKWMFGKESDQAEVILNGIDVREYAYSPQKEKEMREKLKLGEAPVIGNVGRFSKEKNHDFLFLIFKEILKAQPDAILVLCGDGQRREELEEQAKQLSIYEQIRFLGIRRDIPDVLQVMNVFVFPSVLEGYPISLVESQAAGIPTFAAKETVPLEMGITSQMKFLSLEDSPNVWAEAALKELKKEKKSETDKLLESDSSIDKMLEKIEKTIQMGVKKYGN